MQKVGADKPVFIAAGKDVEGHVVELLEIVREAGDQIMIDKAMDIKKCCEWMIRECVIMKNNPSGKTLEERQALSQKIISQLKITFQNLSVATKNFLKKTQATLPSEDPDEEATGYGSSKEVKVVKRDSRAERDDAHSYHNSPPHSNSPSRYNNYERENSDGGDGYSSNPASYPERKPAPFSSSHRSNTNVNPLTRSDGGSGDYSHVPVNVNSTSPSSYDTGADDNDANDQDSPNSDPNEARNRERTLSPRTRDMQSMLANRALMPNRPSRAVSQQVLAPTPSPGRQLSTRQLTGPDRSELTRSDNGRSPITFSTRSNSCFDRPDFIAGRIMSERPASEKTEPVSRAQFDLSNRDRARARVLGTSDFTPKTKQYRAVLQNTRLMMSDADVVATLIDILAENCPVMYDKMQLSQKAEMERSVQYTFAIFKAKLEMESQKKLIEQEPKKDDPSTPRIKITNKAEDRSVGALLNVGRQKRVCREREWGELSPRSNLVKVLNDVCTVFIDVLHEAIVEFNDEAPTWDLTRDTTKPKFDLKYIENHPTRKYCEQGANQIILAIKKLLLNRCAYYTSDFFSVVYNRALVAADEKRKPVQVNVDRRLLRPARRALLHSLLMRLDSISFAVSQYVTTMRSTTGTEADVYYYCHMGISLINLINQTQEEIEELFILLQSECATRTPPIAKLKNTTNVWKEKKTKLDAEGKDETFLPGTIDDILKRMTTSMLNKDLFAAFIYAYPIMFSSKDIWFALESRYNIPKGHSDAPQPENVKMHQVRVTRCLIDWLKCDVFYPIDDEVIAAIQNFTTQMDTDGWFEMALRVNQEINTNAKYSIAPSIKEKPLRIPNYFTAFPAYNVVQESEPQALAEQLTLLDWLLYRRVQYAEFENKNASEDTQKIFCKSINDCVQRTVILAQNVAASIIMQRRLKSRGKLIAKYITIAKICYEINNIPSFVAIVNGLGHSLVERLIHSWARCSTTQILFYKNLKSIVRGGTTATIDLRQHMEQQRLFDTKTVKCIPYIGIYLEDLAKIDESLPNNLTVNGKTLINIPKFQQLTARISSYLKYQSNPYEFEIEEPLYTYLFTLPTFKLSEFEQLSYEREPPGCLAKDLLQ